MKQVKTRTFYLPNKEGKFIKKILPVKLDVKDGVFYIDIPEYMESMNED
ncbi:unnamed protein product, partial [marine sediment metagenome]